MTQLDIFDLVIPSMSNIDLFFLSQLLERWMKVKVKF